MASVGKTRTARFSKETSSLQSLVNLEQFPFVVRVCESEQANPLGIAGGTEILIQRLLRTECAKVRVRPVPGDQNHEAVSCSKSDTCLIPTKCNGKVRFIRFPGDRQRYTSISQVAEDLPRLVRVEEETYVSTRKSVSSNYIIHAKTILRLVRKFILDGSVCLEFTDEQKSYIFDANEGVNFTAVEDTKLYHLYELSRLKLLPQTVQFAISSRRDIPLLDYKLNEEMSRVVNGPISILGFTDVTLIVGWVRDKPRRTYETVIMPFEIWKDIIAQKLVLDDPVSYIRKKYGDCTDTSFVETGMLIMPTPCKKVLWLGSPKHFKNQLTVGFEFEPIQVHFEDSSDSDFDDDAMFQNDDECNMPLPRTSHLKKVKLKQSLFAKVHAEILSWFGGKKSNAKEVTKTGYFSAERCRNNDYRNTLPRRPVHRTQSSLTKSNLPSPVGVYPDSLNKTMLGRTDSLGSCRNHLSCPKELTTKETTTIQDYDAGSVNLHSMDVHGNPSMNIEIVETIMRQGLTSDDFYSYSVLQTSNCFRLSALNDLADICYENRLDGCFFKNLDLDILRNKPFCLSSIQILKVDKIIKGWRSFND